MTALLLALWTGTPVQACVDAQGRQVYQQLPCAAPPAAAISSAPLPPQAERLSPELVSLSLARFRAAQEARDLLAAQRFIALDFEARLGTLSLSRADYLRLLAERLHDPASLAAQYTCGAVLAAGAHLRLRCIVERRGLRSEEQLEFGLEQGGVRIRRLHSQPISD